MSRIGNLPILIPKNINIEFLKNELIIIGPLGKLSYKIPNGIEILLKNFKMYINLINTHKKFHGLNRSLINNMILGVSKGFEKRLQMIGVGFKAQIIQNQLKLYAGFSYPILLKIPSSVKVNIEDNTIIIIEGQNKSEVGLFAAQIRKIRPPEPYKGKGIRIINEIIFRKTGKSGK